MRVEIDEHSGFCFGVVNAIRKAEQELERGMLYCIGDIVHNDLEVERLRLRGLKTIEHEQFARLQHCRVLFRAHGEPPVSYEIAQKNEVEVIDASCPVVLNLQKRIRKAYEQTREQGGQVVIYGKRGHAEVVGLVGQTNGEALVIENPEDIRQIDFSRPVIFTDDQKSGRFSGYCSFAKRERRGTGGGERYDLPESGQSYTSAERVRTET